MDLTHYSILAEFFRYPDEKLKNFILLWDELVISYDPSLHNKLRPFINHVTTKPVRLQQEYYVSTFDVQPVCTLDVGYILFGEDYRRGDFLVNMKKEHIKAQNDCGSELPDHLPNILRLIPLMNNPELAGELIYSLLIPSVKEMIKKFRTSDNLYKNLLEILLRVMEQDFPVSDFEQFTFKTNQAVTGS